MAGLLSSALMGPAQRLGSVAAPAAAATPMASSGLLSMFAPQAAQSPLYQAFDQRRNVLMGALLGGVGAESPLERLRGIAQGALKGREADTAYGLELKKEAQQKQAINKTLELLTQKRPDLAPWVQSGAITPVDAFKEVFSPPEKSNFINAGDGRIFDASKREWLTAPGTASPQSTVGKIMADFNAGLIDAATRDALIQKQAAPEGMELVSDGQGGFTLRQGTLGSGKPLTVDQAKNTGFLVRSVDANKVITQLESAGTSLWNKSMRAVPGGLGNYGLDPQAQKFEQAKRDFVNAVLRRESGAVISEEEFANADQQYFPQPGDGPEVIAQKRQNRLNAIKGFEVGAGPGASEVSPAGGGWQDLGNGVRVRKLD